MMGKRMRITALLLAFLLLTGCAKPEMPVTGDKPATQATAGNIVNTPTVPNPEELFTNRDYETDYDAFATITMSGSAVTSGSNAVNISGTTAQITEAGTYVLSGKLDNGQIVVNAEKTDKIQLVLSGATINSAQSAAIYVLQADKVFITTAKGTENTVSNGGVFEAIDENKIDAAIYSKDDLTFNGEGSLTVISPAGHGIVSKDDLAVTGGSYVVSAASQAFSGKESVKIAGGTFDLTAGKDGIHAEDNDDATLGYGYISGGTFTITAEGDGISASGSLQITGGSFAVTAGGGSENGDKASSDNYGGFMGGGPGGMGRPGGMGDWGGGGQTSTETEEESASMKGIKAGGDLTVLGGTFQIDSADDGIHSNANLTVTGGSFTIATGDDGFHADERLDITAGAIQVTESYEGLEGHHIAVSGGEISLIASDDGLNAAGGTDSSGMGGRDQMFGGGKGGFGGMSSGDGSIVISGGDLYVQASGDGLDANGTLEISGGYTVVCGPTRGDTATLDYDISGVITGGTFIGTGASGMAQTFSDSQNQGVIAIQVGSAGAGTRIALKNSSGKEILAHTPELSFNVVILSSPEMAKGETYTVYVGSQSGTFEAN